MTHDGETVNVSNARQHRVHGERGHEEQRRREQQVREERKVNRIDFTGLVTAVTHDSNNTRRLNNRILLIETESKFNVHLL